jgi:hypothetical protein
MMMTRTKIFLHKNIITEFSNRQKKLKKWQIACWCLNIAVFISVLLAEAN